MKEVFDKIIEQLEDKRKTAEQLIMENPQDELDKIQTQAAEDFASAYKDAIEIVKQEAEKFGTDTNVGSNGWIPFSERLPKEYGDYLVAWRPLSMSAEDIMEKVGREVPHFYEIVEYDPDDEALWIGSIEQAKGEYEIIAWQPLPQPYQPKGEMNG